MNVSCEKKVVIFHHCDQIGGAGMSLRITYEMLSGNFNVVIYVPKEDGDMYRYLQKEGVKCKSLGEGIGQINAYSGGPPIYHRDFYLKFLKIIKSKFQVKRIIKKEKPDLIILNSVTLSWIAKLGYKMQIPTVGYIRETYIETFFMNYSLRYLDKYASGAVFISNYDLANYKTSVNAKMVVRNCVLDDKSNRLSREEACHNLGIDANKFNVLFVGGTRAKELKGFPTLLEASEYLPDDDYQFLICGDIAEPINRNRFIELGIRKDMSILYQASDLLVFPSGFPHQARPAFEAGLYYVPVIISDFEQIRDDVIEGYNGLLFEPLNSKELAEKIERMRNDRNELKRMGENNHTLCIEKHSFARCKEELVNFIKGLM